MSALELITELSQRGIRLSLEGEQLRVRAPKGALTPDLHRRLKEQKASVMDFVRQAQRATRAVKVPTLGPQPRGERLPLSFAQERLWFIDRWEPGSAAYNIFYAIDLEGDAEPRALQTALDEIQRRHEVLRTTYRDQGGKAEQRIHPPAPVALPLVDGSALAEREGPEGAEAWAKGLMEREAARSFDLATGPVLRVLLLRLGPRRHGLLLNLHHIAADGWSTGVLVEELIALYQAFVAGAPSPLPELPLQYADFALWQRGWLVGEAVEDELEYWRRRLAGISDDLELPADRPPPAEPTSRGESLAFRLEAGEVAAARSWAQARGMTPFAVFLAAWKALLHRYSGRSEIVVGSPTANRNRTELEGLIGFFVNTLVLRTEVAGGGGFQDLVAAVGETVMGAQEHQNLPFERIVETLAPRREPGRNPFFQVLFVFQNAPMPAVEVPGLSLRSWKLENATSKFDLTLTLLDMEPEMEGEVEYRTDLYDRTTVLRLVQHYRQLLRSALAQPGEPLARLQLLAPAERHQLVQEWNATAAVIAPPLGHLEDFFERWAEVTPEAPAVRLGEEVWSYRTLELRAAALALRLRQLGVAQDHRVGVFLGRSLGLPMAVLAALKAGAGYVPLDPRYPADRLRFMMADSAPAVIVTDAHHHAALGELAPPSVPVLRLDELLRLEERELELLPRSSAAAKHPDSLAYLIYTSGSTGRPKGVAMPHRPLVELFRWQLDQSRRGGATLQFAALSFDVSCQELFCTWGAGGTLVLVEDDLPRDAQRLLRRMAEDRVERIFLPFVALQNLAQAALAGGGEEAPALALREVITAGEQLQKTPALTEWLGALPQCSLVNQYGPSETHVVSAWSWPAGVSLEEAPALPPIGRPVTGARLYILDGRGQPTAAVIPGELCLGGQAPARGYFRRPALTAEKFVPDPWSPEPGGRMYRTGDLARWRSDGEVEFLGRLDHQVKVRGYRVELGEIESALAQLPGVAEAVCVARSFGSVGTGSSGTGSGQTVDSSALRLVAYWVATEGSEPAVEELQRELAKALPEYMIPSHWVLLEELPLTPSGKVDRRSLPEPSAGRRSGDRVLPRNATEELLAGIWQQLLESEVVGVHENFFTLGGHSLLATQLMARVGETFGVDLALRVLFEKPTVAQLAEAVTAALERGEEWSVPPLVSHPEREDFPLSFPQQAIWLFEQLVPGTPAYNTTRAGRLWGRVDAAALEAAVGEMVRRHAVLRTSYHRRGSEAYQRIHPHRPVPMPVVDLGRLPEAVRDEEALRLSNQEAQTPFDLTQAPVARAYLLRLSPEDNVFLLGVHHIAYDLWSGGLLLGELEQLYIAFAAGEVSPLEPLPLRYADFAVWQREWLQGEVLTEQLEYWRRQLAGLLDDPPSLPTDRPRPADPSHRGGATYLRLSRELSDAVLHLGRGHGCTEYMTLLAVFVTFLYRMTQSPDVVVGSFITNRNRVELEGLMGFFDNTVVLRTDAAGDPTFVELLGRVKEVALGAYAHQYLPFERLVEDLQPERSEAANQLFQAAFIHMLNYPAMERDVAGLKMVPYALESRSAKFDFSLALRDAPAGLAGEIEYDEDLFDGTTVQRMAAQLRRLVEAVTRDPQQRLDRLPLLGSAERHQLLVELNDTAAAVAATSAQELVRRRALQQPEAAAVRRGESSLSYGELQAQAAAWARRLRSSGATTDSVVAVLAERSLEMVVGQLAVLAAGAAYLPLDPALPRERLLFMVQDSGALQVLAQQEALDPALGAELERLGASVEILDLSSMPEPSAGAEAGGAGGESFEETSPDALAYVIYTSGSTGRPKGVGVPHRGLSNLVAWYRHEFSPTAQDRVAVMAGLGFDVLVSELWPNLAAGACLLLPEEETRRDPRALLGWLARERATLAFAPTPLGEAMMRLPAPTDLVLRVLMVAGDRLHAGPPPGLPYTVHNIYGPTESTVYATHAPAATGSVSPPIGRPVTNTRALVASSRQRLLALGLPGELLLAGTGLARGYRGRPGLTADRFRPDPWATEAGARLYRTGDRVRLAPASGDLEFFGRFDHQVKIRGYRIELGEIESALREHPRVSDAVVLARPSEGWAGRPGEKVLQGFWLAPEGAPAEELPSPGELRTHLLDRLPEYMVPARLVLLDSLPTTASGKVDRRALLARGDADISSPEGRRASAEEPGMEAQPPRDGLERQLLEIWRELPGFAASGISDHFLELGGHSLLALHLAERVEQALGRPLPVSQIFRRPTVAALAEFLRRDEAAAGTVGEAGGAPADGVPEDGAPVGEILVELQGGGEEPPIFCVHPVGGQVYCYAQLARALGTQRPFYGLQAPPPSSSTSATGPQWQLEELAELYAEAVKGRQLDGPYLLLGWSMGGVVAFEMARRLAKEGRNVAFLGLLDAEPWAEPVPRTPSRAQLLAEFTRDLAAGGDGLGVERLAELDEDEQLQAVLDWVRAADLLPVDLPLSALRRHFQVFLANLRALVDYRPRPYDGALHLFRPELSDSSSPLGGWESWARGGVELRVPAGDHYSMLQPPLVEGLARQLGRAVEAALAASPASPEAADR